MALPLQRACSHSLSPCSKNCEHSLVDTLSHLPGSCFQFLPHRKRSGEPPARSLYDPVRCCVGARRAARLRAWCEVRGEEQRQGGTDSRVPSPSLPRGFLLCSYSLPLPGAPGWCFPPFLATFTACFVRDSAQMGE